jgi:hypothetical protein
MSRCQHRVGYYSDGGLVVYSVHAGFKCPPEDQLFWVQFFAISRSHSMKTLDNNLEYAATVSF